MSERPKFTPESYKKENMPGVESLRGEVHNLLSNNNAMRNLIVAASNVEILGLGNLKSIFE